MKNKVWGRLPKWPPITVLMALLASPTTTSAQIIPPDKFVGFRVGADRKLFGWDTVVRYFEMLDSKSDRVTVHQLGTTTLEKPFLMVLVSSPTNLMNLARYKNLQKQAANPRHLSEEDAKTLARQNKLVVLLALNVRAEEVASSQGSLELAYRLATGEDGSTKRILDETIILLVPSLNPDGMQLMVDWYMQYRGSSAEGGPLPVLPHHFTGKDLDRDWPILNLRETRLLAKEIYQEWFPELVFVLYPGATRGPRLLLPHYINPDGMRLEAGILNRANTLAGHLALDLKEKGLAGIETEDLNIAALRGSLVGTALSHNMTGIVASVAGVQIATPLFFPRGSTQESHKRTHNNADGTDSEDLWHGGWWRLRDVVDYELALMLSLLDIVAQKKEAIIYDFCKANRNAISEGEKPPRTYLIPQAQNDPMALSQVIQTMLLNGVEIHQTLKEHRIAGQTIERGAFWLHSAQPFGAYLGALFEPQVLNTTPMPGTSWSILSGAGSLTIPTTMGLRIFEFHDTFQGESAAVDSLQLPSSKSVFHENMNMLISHTDNRSFALVNRLLNRRKKVFWLRDEVVVDGRVHKPGAILVPAKEVKTDEMSEFMEGLDLEFLQTVMQFEGYRALRLDKFRLGLYRPWTANEDEGWTRFVLQKFDFPLKLLHNANLVRDKLSGDFDVIVIPDMTESELINGTKLEKPNIYTPKRPKPYRDGITEKGVENLVEFVEEGGVLITLNRACEFAITRFGLPVTKLTREGENIRCQSALLELQVDDKEAIAYGMSSKAAAVFLDSPFLKPIPWRKRTSVGAFISSENSHLDGWCPEAEELQGLPAVMEIPVAKGRIVLISFRPQFRGQTAGTYKFLFNAIQLSNTREVIVED